MDYSLRPAVDAYIDFLYYLLRAALREYVEPIWGWHEEWQTQCFREHFDTANRQIIMVDGQGAGVLVVADKPEVFYLG